MENNEVIEGNKLIAEFMGCVLKNESEQKVRVFFNQPIPSSLSDNWCWSSGLEYHSSWDWLMPVVDKIESLDIPFDDFSVEICGYVCIVRGDHIQFEQTSNDSKIEATYLAVIDFINWFNKTTNLK